MNYKKHLDEEEKEIIDEIEKANFVEFTPKEKDKIMKSINRSFKQSIEKEKFGLYLKLDKKDVESIKDRAEKKGLPYQTLIKSILHQYSEGRLKEVDK